MSVPMLKKCVVLATGGTIAGWADDPSQAAYQAASQPVNAVLGDLSPGKMVWETEQVAQVDSSAMTPALWLRLQARLRHWLAQPDVAGVIVTHGTDTLEETAFFLHHTLPTQGKPVVLTGAMRAANHPQADGPDNLRAARDWVAQAPASGVWVVMAGQAHHPHGVQKVQTHPANAAFSSGPAGPFAQWQSDSGNWGLASGPAGAPPPQHLRDTPWPAADAWPWVALVWSYAGADGREVDALMAGANPPRAWVVAATGAGTLAPLLQDALQRAHQRGALVWRTSRCVWGQGEDWVEPSWAPICPLPPVKARIALQLMLMASERG